MEPRIQYARTADGVNIAFWTVGEGTPVVRMPTPPWSQVELEWRTSRWLRLVAERMRLIAYDNRGSGLSDREVKDFSLEAHLADLEAVVDHLGLETFALFAAVHAGPTAIVYAARHPERVSHLILWCAYARVSDWSTHPRAQAMRGILEKDWRLYTETVARVVMGAPTAEGVRSVARSLREMTTHEACVAAMSAHVKHDATDALSEVRCPTLVLHRRGVKWPDIDLARGIASRIPDAQLVALEGRSAILEAGDTEAALRAIDDFLSEGQEPAAAPDLPEGTAVILFADIADSTALTERIGDAAFREKARALDGVLRGVIRENGGTPVEGKLLGDGVLAVFTSARQAIEAALACGRAGDGGFLLHLGLHAGDVIREDDPDGRSNIYGGAVNIAARISALSAPGEVLVSDTLRGLARTSAGVSFEDRGERELKGVTEPQRLFAVRRDDP